MTQEIGQFVVRLGAEKTEFINELEAAKRQLRGYGTESKKIVESNEHLAKSLKNVQAANDGANRSAKQLQQATNGLPAQFTDIAVSLQGGQNPLTVFLQQGGQLKDMFGGIGPAAKALSGYVLGLINPMSIAAAGITAVGVAYYQGSEEADKFREAIASTGNPMGLSVDLLSSYAANLDRVIGTQGKAAEVLAEIAGTGKIASTELSQVAIAAINMERATGKAASETVAEFAKLAKDPLDAAVKLNEQFNFLTASAYEQMAALKASGNNTEAVKIVFDAYADAINSRSNEIVSQLGYIERGWVGIKDAASEAWDWTKNIGRDDTLEQQLNAVGQKIQELRALGEGSEGEAVRRKNMMDGLLAQRDAIESQLKLNRDLTAEQQKQAKLNDDSIKAQQRIAVVTEAGLTNDEKRNKAIKQYLADLEKVRAANPSSNLLSNDSTSKTLKSINEQYADKTADKEIEANQRKFESLNSMLQDEETKARNSYQKRLDDVNSLTLTETQIREAGFSTIEELRTYYAEQARLAYVNDLDQVTERNAREIEQERVKQEGLISAKQEASEFLKQWYLEQQTLLANQSYSEQEAQAAGFASQEEARAAFEDNLKLAYEDRLAYIESHNEKEIDSENRKWQRLDREQKKYTKQRTSMEQSLANKSLSIIESSLEEGSGVWIAAVLAQQGMMAAQAIMNANLASAMTRAAMIIPGDPTSPARAEIEAGRVKTMGYIDAALIMAQGVGKIAGAREFGGPVLGGYNYLVGENGPEIVNFGQSGTVHPNRTFNELSGGGTTQVTLYQTIDARGADAGVESRLATVADQIADSAYHRVLTDVQESGPIRRELNK